MTPETLALAKAYCAIVPDMPSNQPVEAVNPALATLYRQYTHQTDRLPDTVTEADVVQTLDRHLIP